MSIAIYSSPYSVKFASIYSSQASSEKNKVVGLVDIPALP